MKKIFISRELKSSSPVIQVLDKHTVVDKSLITFSALQFEAPKADWIFFYSRNGVKYFFRGGNYELFPYLWACMSDGTANELSHYVTDISFVGNGNPEDVARDYNNVIGDNDVTCFIRAENSQDSVNNLRSKQDDISIPVYNNEIISNVPQDKFDILIFTSPMNVDAWFQKRKYDGEEIIAIGMTTFKQISTHGILKAIVADKPSELSIAHAVKKLL